MHGYSTIVMKSKSSNNYEFRILANKGVVHMGIAKTKDEAETRINRYITTGYDR